ncbi:MAG: hypothetical protein EOP04_29035, partial [Proteobacteria bacterium]
LDKRKVKKDGTYPVKLTVYFEGGKERYKTGVSLTPDQWERLNKANLRDDDLRKIKRKLAIKKEQAEAIIDRLDPFTYEAFEEELFHDKKVRNTSDLGDMFNEYIAHLEQQGRVGSSTLYNTAKNSFLAFKPKAKVTDITTKFLEDYEKHMLVQDISPTTIGIYMRHLRAIVNVAISKKLLSAERYPFKGYAIPSSRNVKKALTAAQLKLLLNYQTNDESERRALDFWLFSYISNGMNFTDICHLKPNDIKGEFFHFFRAKTQNTKKRDKRPIKVPLTPETCTIIERWRSKDPTNPFLFPILEAGLTPKQAKYKIQDFIAKVNSQMRLIADKLGIDVKIGTYVARHSHSTILKRQGVPTELIKENLGHSSVLTTENYLDDFE